MNRVKRRSKYQYGTLTLGKAFPRARRMDLPFRRIRSRAETAPQDHRRNPRAIPNPGGSRACERASALSANPETFTRNARPWVA